MKKVIFTLFLILLLSFSVIAEEGMWLLSQLDRLDLNKKGLQIKPGDIYHPDKTSISDAIVWLGNCSASFVSRMD